jgi:hypothetical protein
VYGDTLISPKLLVELITAHVNGHRLFGATLEHAVGEAARRRPDINDSTSGWIDGEPVKGGIKFLTRSAYEPGTIAENNHRFARVDHACWLQRWSAAHCDSTRLDQFSGLSTIRREFAPHEFSVEAAPSSHRELSAEARAHER